MGKGKITSDGFLFEEEYIEILQNLIKDPDSNERIRTLYNFYKEKNPNFLVNLLHYVRPVCFKEYTEIDDDNQIDQINGYIHPNFLKDGDANQLKDGRLLLEQIFLKMHSAKFLKEMKKIENNSLSITSTVKPGNEIPHIKLYFDILDFYFDPNMDTSKEDEKIFVYTEKRKGQSIEVKLTARERLAILRLFQDTGGPAYSNSHLNSGEYWANEKGKKEKYQRFLSVILGIKRSTLDSYVMEQGEYFKPIVGTGTLGQAKDALNSIKKIQKIFEDLQDNGSFNSQISNYESKLNKKISSLTKNK